MTEPSVTHFSVTAIGPYDRPMYETVVSMQGLEIDDSFSEAIKFAQRSMQDAGITRTVEGWFVRRMKET